METIFISTEDNKTNKSNKFRCFADKLKLADNCKAIIKILC